MILKHPEVDELKEEDMPMVLLFHYQF